MSVSLIMTSGTVRTVMNLILVLVMYPYTDRSSIENSTPKYISCVFNAADVPNKVIKPNVMRVR